MRKVSSPAAALAALALAACGGGITVRRTAASAPPKPASCELEILQKAPPRPYDELASLESHVTHVPKDGALSVLKPKACELGADALVVVRNMVLNELGHTLVAAIAIRYRPEAPKAETAPAPAGPEAQESPKLEPKQDAPPPNTEEPAPRQGEEPR